MPFSPISTVDTDCPDSSIDRSPSCDCQSESVTAVGAGLQDRAQFLRDLDEIGEDPGCFFDVAGAVIRRRMGRSIG